MATRADFECVDCKVDTSQHGINEYYMVYTHLWRAAGMRINGGMLCIGCLETRLGRELNAADFTLAPINQSPLWGSHSERLQNRLSRT